MNFVPAVSRKVASKELSYIELRRGTPFSLARLVADGYLSKDGLARAHWERVQKRWYYYTSLVLYSRVILLFNGTR